MESQCASNKNLDNTNIVRDSLVRLRSGSNFLREDRERQTDLCREERICLFAERARKAKSTFQRSVHFWRTKSVHFQYDKLHPFFPKGQILIEQMEREQNVVYSIGSSSFSYINKLTRRFIISISKIRNSLISSLSSTTYWGR